MRRVLLLGLSMLVSACNTTGETGETSSSSSSGAPIGGACSIDSECLTGMCRNGVCAVAGISSSSGGTVSGNTSTVSSSSAGASSDMPDAGPPLGTPSTDPATGPIEFGAARLGVPVEKLVLLDNVGAGPLTLVQAGVQTLDGSSTQDFTVETTSTLPATLPPSSQASVRIRYTPRTATAVNARLVLAFTSSTVEQVTLDLVALFKGSPQLTLHRAAADTGASITGLQVGPVPVGQSVTEHVLVKNTGAEGSALTIDAVVVEPAGNTAFTVLTAPLPRPISLFPGACTTTDTCGPGADACTDGLCVGMGVALDVVDVAVTYSATTAGVSNASLVVRATGSGGTIQQSIPLTGTGQLGALVASPSPLPFGDVFLQRDAVRDVEIRNASNVTLSVSALEWAAGSSPVFTLPAPQPSLPALLGPNATVTVPVRFAPDANASFTGQLVVRSPTADALTVDVSGRGVEAPSIRAQASLDFGDQAAGSARVLPVDIHNDGPGVLRLGAMSVVGSGTFTFQPTVVTAPVNPNSTTTLQVTFAPGAASSTPVTAELVVASNDPDRAETRITLSGRSVAPVANTSRMVVDLGTVRVGAMATTVDVRVTNTGIGPLTVTGMGPVVDGGGAPLTDFTVSPSRMLPATVAEGGTDAVVFTFGFAPGAGGQQTGTFTFGTNDASRALVTLTVTGRGLACSTNHVPNPTESNGVCDGTCEMGWDDCNMNKATDGCEISTLTELAHCGGCSLACSTAQVLGAACMSGACTGNCADGYGDCNSNLRQDGCETNINESASHCGGCRMACSANNVPTPSCFDGDCTGACATGYGDCNMDRRTDGCEINTNTNPAHCGDCMRACSNNHVTTPTCGNGTCDGACDPGWFDCDNAKLINGCETDTATSVLHCGGCGMACSTNNIAESCQSGLCNGTCDDGFLDCNSDRRSDGCEVNGDTDNAHCGNCTTTCSLNEQCTDGVCVPQCTVIINEVATEDASNQNTSEFIELFNPCPAAINLRGYRLKYLSSGQGAGADPFVFPTTADVMLDSLAYYLVGKGSFASAADAPMASASGLNVDGGGLGLHNALGTRVDSMAWGTAEPGHVYIEGTLGPVDAAGGMDIFRRSPNGRDTQNTRNDWVQSTAAGQVTPGAANP